jgi:hypothetical protein
METTDIKIDEYIKIRVEAQEDDIQSESMWCKFKGWIDESQKIGQAEIGNIPWFVDHVAFKDLIKFQEIDEMFVYIETLEQKTFTVGCGWKPTASDDDGINAEWKQIVNHLEGEDYMCEGAAVGIFSIAVPIEKTKEDLVAHAESCPVPLQIY